MNKKGEMQSLHLLNHSKCILAAFQNFRQDETMLDVTLACDGKIIKAHKMVLSACSPFFKNIFADNPCPHPVVFMKDVEFIDLKALIDFIYKGELLVPRERLLPTLKLAEELQVRGLMRSEPHKENYEKLYKKFCEKQYGRRRRKRHRQSSSESEEKECASDSVASDQGSEQSDDSVNQAENIVPDSQILDEENFDSNCNSSDAVKNVRPVVLRVGEPSTSSDMAATDGLVNVPSSEEPGVSGEYVYEESGVSGEYMYEEPGEPDGIESQEKIPACDAQVIEEQMVEEVLPADSNNILSPSFESFTTCPEINDVSNTVTEGASSPVADAENFEDMTVDTKIADPVEGMDIPCCSKDQIMSPVLSSNLPSTSETTNHSNKAVLHPQTKKKGIVGFECRTCKRVFTSRTVLIRHEIIVHKATDSSLPFKCRFCTFAAKKAGRLKYHMLVHSKERPHKCTICSKGFKFDHQLQQHLLVHTEEKLFSCSKCPSKFKRHGSLLIHSRMHRQETPFMCRHCCKKFFRGSDLLKHEETCKDNMKPEQFKILKVDNLSEM